MAGSGPRAVVTTASYEARKFGVFSATPASRARRLCPDAVFLPPDFKLYRERSRAVMDVLRAHIDRVEVVGLDEAYLDLTGFERPKAAARRVKAAVEDETGLACSIGIGPSKLVAKVASDAEKPNGFVVLTREQACERFGGVPAGPDPRDRAEDRRAARGAGIDTLAKLATTSGGGAHELVRPAARAAPRAGSHASSTRARSRPSASRSRSRARRPSTTTSVAWRRSRPCSSG